MLVVLGWQVLGKVAIQVESILDRAGADVSSSVVIRCLCLEEFGDGGLRGVVRHGGEVVLNSGTPEEAAEVAWWDGLEDKSSVAVVSAGYARPALSSLVVESVGGLLEKIPLLKEDEKSYHRLVVQFLDVNLKHNALFYWSCPAVKETRTCHKRVVAGVCPSCGEVDPVPYLHLNKGKFAGLVAVECSGFPINNIVMCVFVLFLK